MQTRLIYFAPIVLLFVDDVVASRTIAQWKEEELSFPVQFWVWAVVGGGRQYKRKCH